MFNVRAPLSIAREHDFLMDTAQGGIIKKTFLRFNVDFLLKIETIHIKYYLKVVEQFVLLASIFEDISLT